MDISSCLIGKKQILQWNILVLLQQSTQAADARKSISSEKDTYSLPVPLLSRSHSVIVSLKYKSVVRVLLLKYARYQKRQAFKGRKGWITCKSKNVCSKAWGHCTVLVCLWQKWVGHIWIQYIYACRVQACHVCREVTILYGSLKILYHIS